jgi:hypothetical protein
MDEMKSTKYAPFAIAPYGHRITLLRRNHGFFVI